MLAFGRLIEFVQFVGLLEFVSEFVIKYVIWMVHCIVEKVAVR